MYCNSSGGVCVIFEIDVKGGEIVVISKMLQWYSQGNNGIVGCSSRGCHQCQRGRLLACFQTEAEYACLSLMEKIIKIISAAIMAWKWKDQQ
jgi:hypothetical protein